MVSSGRVVGGGGGSGEAELAVCWQRFMYATTLRQGYALRTHLPGAKQLRAVSLDWGAQADAYFWIPSWFVLHRERNPSVYVLFIAPRATGEAPGIVSWQCFDLSGYGLSLVLVGRALFGTAFALGARLTSRPLWGISGFGSYERKRSLRHQLLSLLPSQGFERPAPSVSSANWNYCPLGM